MPELLVMFGRHRHCRCFIVIQNERFWIAFFMNFNVLVPSGELVVAASMNMERLSALYWIASL
jgi:hypothetical protein